MELKQQHLGVDITAAEPKTRVEMTTGSEVMWCTGSHEGRKWGEKGPFQRAADQWGCSTRTLPEPVCIITDRENKRSEGMLEDSCCRATQRHQRIPISDADWQGKRRKTNLMRSESAWASANDGLHLTQQQCEQRSSGRDREHVTLTTGRF